MKEIIVAERQDFIDVANAIRTKAGSSVQLSFPEGMIEAIENIKIGSSGGGSSSGSITLKPDYLDIPEIYKPYIAYAKRQYTGSYEYLAVLDWREHVAVMFILDNFGIDEYEPEMSEFKAHGWISYSYDRNTEEWTFNDWRNETSTGGNYVRHIRYSSMYWEYNGETLWPYDEDIEENPIKGSVAFIPRPVNFKEEFIQTIGNIITIPYKLPQPVNFKEEFIQTIGNIITIPYKLPIIVNSFEEVIE